MLDKKHRVVGADGGFEQALGIRRGARSDHIQPREVSEDRIGRLGVGCRKLAAAAADRADHNRHTHLPAEHIVQLGSLVDDHVHGRKGKVDCHQLGHRAQAGQRSADGPADDGVLRNRRIADALFAKVIVEPLGDRISAAPYADLFSHDKDFRIAFHFLPQSLGDGFTHCHSRHDYHSSSTT